MALPQTYSELYPGRFLKADLLKGKRVLLTIKNVDVEELIGENNKAAAKVIVSFVERPLELVLPKTNGECLKRMFGNNPHLWIGKRIVLFPTTTSFGRAIVDCIRIWGSPDIAADMEISIPQGRKKALEMVMHKVEVRSANGNSAPAAAPTEGAIALDPRIEAGFTILNWDPQQRAAFLARNPNSSAAEMLTELNAVIDQ